MERGKKKYDNIKSEVGKIIGNYKSLMSDRNNQVAQLVTTRKKEPVNARRPDPKKNVKSKVASAWKKPAPKKMKKK